MTDTFIPSWAPLAAMGIMGLSTAFIAAGLSRKGVKAIVLARGDDAHAYLANVFKLSIALGAVFCAAYAIWPSLTIWLGPLDWLATPVAAKAGLALMLSGALLVAAAQLNMGRSWRVGIDHEHETSLVTTGLHRVSRNPIYLGMFAVIAGVFLAVPNAITLSLLCVATFAISAQVRLEEEFLTRLHGQVYAAYRARTRRWI